MLAKQVDGLFMPGVLMCQQHRVYLVKFLECFRRTGRVVVQPWVNEYGVPLRRTHEKHRMPQSGNMHRFTSLPYSLANLTPKKSG
jgi:hypothetical protein